LPADIFQEFLTSADALRVYAGDTLACALQKDGLPPLTDYLAAYGAICQKVIIYDKVMVNAAALLSVRNGATGVVPCIRRADGNGVCPMEELPPGKEPDEFYRIMKARPGTSV
jgi:hypothetical protein